MRAPLLLLLLAACEADETADEATLPPPDPDVNTFLPPDYVPAAPTRLVLLGDSISAGVGSSRDELAYPALLQRNDRRKWPAYQDVDLQSVPGTIEEVIDVSEGGATTGSMLRGQVPRLERELGDVPAKGQTVVVFTIGGNDIQGALLPLANPREIADAALANFETIVGDIRDLFEEEPFLFATNVYEPSDGVGSTRDCFFGIDYADKLPELDRFNEELARLGKEMGFSVVDLRGHFEGHGFYHDDPANDAWHADDPTLWFADDCIHPNDRGHHEIRRLFHASILGQPLRLEEAEADE